MKSAPSLKARALQLLAQREHSRLELRRKLLAFVSRQAATQHGAAADAAEDDRFNRRMTLSPAMEAGVDALLDELTANQHLSEPRFVESRLRARVARVGNLRICQELAQHGLRLSPEEARTLDDSEFARAKQVWARKFGALPADAAGRARQMRFLAGRGFSPDAIRRLLRCEGE